jgi:NAD(P)-dependent dehydrogenase (short-subunit alcohol dehydrogenase family)
MTVSRFMVVEADPDSGMSRIRYVPVPGHGPITIAAGQSLTEPIGPAQPTNCAHSWKRTFSASSTSRAALPHFRERGSGHFVQVSSSGGLTAFPLVSAYNASKWALEGLTESFAQEVADLGVKVTLFQPDYMDTD